MATFWEIAARSVSNLFSLYFVYLKYLFISRFGFKSGICLLIAPVPVHCFSITLSRNVNIGKDCLPSDHVVESGVSWTDFVMDITDRRRFRHHFSVTMLQSIHA